MVAALDRLDPVLPLSPGRAERHGFEYYRHGTLSLYAALDVKTGKVEGKTAKRHTSVPLHADLFFLAQSGGAVVCQDSARCHCPWRLYFGGRFSSQTAEIHSRLRQLRQTISLDLHGPEASHPYLRNHRDSSLETLSSRYGNQRGSNARPPTAHSADPLESRLIKVSPILTSVLHSPNATPRDRNPVAQGCPPCVRRGIGEYKIWRPSPLLRLMQRA